MKLRTYITEVFGAIKDAIRNGSQVAAVVHGVDQRVGKKGAHGKKFTKNPFKGIAHSNGSSYGPKFFRHVDGARDSRPSSKHLRFSLLSAPVPHKDSNPHPVSFV